MAQTLLIGLGGTGSRAVNLVVKKLYKNGKTVNDGNICCAVLDTNKNDTELVEGTGTGIPVVATSKSQKIEDYFADYRHTNILEWAPDSPEFRKESMVSGASEHRVKSRIAFMDCVQTGAIAEIDRFINQVLALNDNSKISVMLVSSLSGGTGSGMFIQVALWLRERLKKAQIVMRGIFLLPDVFVSTLRDIRSSRTKIHRHYANAYAAIRELNAISKIRNKGHVTLPQEISLDGLFSSADGAQGKSVFDFAFFIDSVDQNGVSLESIRDYEAAVADLVYMQMYAPLQANLYSEEDNNFLQSSKSEEPLYGSCGTAVAVYPVDDVIEYCALRAVQDSLKGGWQKIDDEIAALKKEAVQRKKEGYTGSTKIDEDAKYMEIFESRTAAKEGTARDPFFAAIAEEVINLTPGEVINDEQTFLESDKVQDFIKAIARNVISPMATSLYNPARYAIDSDAFVRDEHSVADLITRVTEDKNGFNAIIRNFDRSREKHVDDIVSSIMPYTMQEDMEHAANTIMALLTTEVEKKRMFVHPVSVRYMLLKLIRDLKAERKRFAITASRAKVLADNDEDSPKFDNKATADVTEADAMAYLESKKWYQREKGFTDHFEKEYADFINAKVTYCIKYITESIEDGVFEKLEQRLTELLQKFEALFADLQKVKTKVEDELADIADPVTVANKKLYVFAKPEHKESIYASLELDLHGGRGINQSVITALYGNLCAQKRPDSEENKPYAKSSVADTFLGSAKKVFSDMITQTEENKPLIYLSIYEAICKECDWEGYHGQEDRPEIRRQKQRTKFIQYVRLLERMAAPFLQPTREGTNELGETMSYDKVLWGFHPRVAEEYAELGALLDVNVDTLQSDAYPINELYCYTALYNIKAENIPKFNELTGGIYYTSYKAIIDEMLEMQKGSFGDDALVQSPHLDKRWHSILPYITSGKENEDQLSFYCGIWLAIAYGVLVVNKEGNFCVNKKVETAFKRSTSRDAVPILYNGKPVASRDAVKLIEALKTDSAFVDGEIPELEERFQNELEDISTYEATQVLRGLKAAKGDLSPVDLLVRYSRSKTGAVTDLKNLVAALEEIAYRMVENYHDNSRSEESKTLAQYAILRRIYDAAALTKEKGDVLSDWVREFDRLGVKGEAEAADTPID